MPENEEVAAVETERKPWTDEQRQKQSDAMKTAWADPEKRARMSAAIKAAMAAPETQEKMRLAREARAAAKAEEVE